MERLDFSESQHDVIAEEGIGLAGVAHQGERLTRNYQTIDDGSEGSRILRHIELKHLRLAVTIFLHGKVD